MKLKMNVVDIFKGIVVLAAFSSLVIGQKNNVESQLKQPTQALYLKEVTLTHAVSQIAIKYKISIGIEIPFNDKDLKADINVESGTMEDIIQGIVSAFPNYEWTTVDEVINISPKIKQDNILDVGVKEYKTTENTGLGIRKSITDIPEVKLKMQQLGVEPFHLSVGSLTTTIVKEDFSMCLQNVTVRKILNELSKSTSNKYWVLTKGGDNGELLFIYL